MSTNQPFTIGSVAPTLAEFKKLSLDDQGIAFLRRLAALFPAARDFHRNNLSLPFYDNPDSAGLCTGWPREDARPGIDYLLKTCWRTIEGHGYIVEGLSGQGGFEVSEEGWKIVKNPTNITVPDRAVLGAIRLLHPDLQGYEHYFREGKLKEAATAAFTRVENRLNEIRDGSPNASIKTVSGVDLPHKLFDTGDLSFPFPKLAAANPRSREAYSANLKGLLKASVGWFRNSFDHEPHNLPNLTEGEALELLFVASYMLRIIDRSV